MDSSAEDRLTAVRMTNRLLESSGKQGVYYVVKLPTRWRLYAFPWEDFGDLWHGDAWRRYMAKELSEIWERTVKVTPDELKPWWKGFPRGRVERLGVLEYTVFHADDLDGTGITPARIEAAFELTGSRVNWSLDPHEQQSPEHADALRRLLHFS